MVLCVCLLDSVEYFEYETRSEGLEGSMKRRSGGPCHMIVSCLIDPVLASEVLVEMSTSSFAGRGTHGIRLHAIDSYNRARPCHSPASGTSES